MPATPPPELPTYRELAPSPALAPWVECFWSIRASDAAGVVNRVVPDGCADLITGVGGDLEPIVVGTMRTAMLSRLTGPVDLFGVRFHPGAALALIDVPLGELTDRRVELEALWGTDAAALGEAFGPPDLTERAARAEQVLHRRLARWARRRRGDEAMVTEAVALLRRARGGAGVRDVAAALGVGERRLERAFDRSVGVSPKMLDRVMRFRRAIQLLAREPVDAAERGMGCAGAAGRVRRPAPLHPRIQGAVGLHPGAICRRAAGCRIRSIRRGRRG